MSNSFNIPPCAAVKMTKGLPIPGSDLAHMITCVNNAITKSPDCNPSQQNPSQKCLNDVATNCKTKTLTTYQYNMWEQCTTNKEAACGLLPTKTNAELQVSEQCYTEVQKNCCRK